MILDAVGQVLGEAVGILISPLPLAAVILILFSRQALPNGVAFLVGWIVGLAVVGAVVLLLAGAADVGGDTDATKGSGALHVALGIVLIVLSLRLWRHRPRHGDTPVPPRWMNRLDGITPPGALALGALLAVVNPKNLILTVSAATSVAQVNLSTADAVVAWALFVVLASLSVAAPIVYRLAQGARAEATLHGWRTWLEANNAVVMAVLLLVIGAKILGNGLGVVS